MWELEGIDGSWSEAAIVVRIKRGELAASRKARPVGAEKWRPVGAHEAFAAALDTVLAKARRPASPPSVQRSQLVGFAAAWLILAIVSGAWFLVGGKLIIAKGADGFGKDERTFIVLP